MRLTLIIHRAGVYLQPRGSRFMLIAYSFRIRTRGPAQARLVIYGTLSIRTFWKVDDVLPQVGERHFRVQNWQGGDRMHERCIPKYFAFLGR